MAALRRRSGGRVDSGGSLFWRAWGSRWEGLAPQAAGRGRGPGGWRRAVLDDRDAKARQAPVSDQKKESAPLTLRDVIKYSEPSQKAMDDVKDYTAVFTKTELIRGRQVKQVMEMKFRAK